MGILLIFYPFVPVLTIRVNGSEETSYPIPLGERATLYFIHSSERTPWLEEWNIDASGIKVIKICWKGFSAGHPETIGDIKGEMGYEGDFACIYPYDLNIGKKIVIGIGSMVNGSFTIGKFNYRSGGNITLIEVRVNTMSIWDVIMNNLVKR